MKDPKKQPRLEDCSNLLALIERSYYGVPEGIFISALKNDNVEYAIVYSKDKSEKDVYTRDWYFRFRKGGKNKSWLCFDVLIY